MLAALTGPTEALNGWLEHLRGIALDFRKLPHYIARSLFDAQGIWLRGIDVYDKRTVVVEGHSSCARQCQECVVNCLRTAERSCPQRAETGQIRPVLAVYFPVSQYSEGSL